MNSVQQLIERLEKKTQKNNYPPGTKIKQISVEQVKKNTPSSEK